VQKKLISEHDSNRFPACLQEVEAFWPLFNSQCNCWTLCCPTPICTVFCPTVQHWTTRFDR